MALPIPNPSDCCEDGHETYCCPGIALPSTLYATIVYSGTCSCPTSAELYKQAGVPTWDSEVNVCTTERIVVGCYGTPGIASWQIVNPVGGTLVSVSCDPFKLVFTTAFAQCQGVMATITIQP